MAERSDDTPHPRLTGEVDLAELFADDLQASLSHTECQQRSYIADNKILAAFVRYQSSIPTICAEFSDVLRKIGVMGRREAFTVISDPEGSQSQTEILPNTKSNGIYISRVTIFVYILFSVALAAVVGCIVHFTQPSCGECNAMSLPPITTQSPEALWEECVNMSWARNECKIDFNHIWFTITPRPLSFYLCNSFTGAFFEHLFDWEISGAQVLLVPLSPFAWFIVETMADRIQIVLI